MTHRAKGATKHTTKLSTLLRHQLSLRGVEIRQPISRTVDYNKAEDEFTVIRYRGVGKISNIGRVKDLGVN